MDRQSYDVLCPVASIKPPIGGTQDRDPIRETLHPGDNYSRSTSIARTLVRGNTEFMGLRNHYFRKMPADLDLFEAALLTGLIKAPSIYSPVKHPDRALQRRNAVIDAMLENGTITLASCEDGPTRDCPEYNGCTCENSLTRIY